MPVSSCILTYRKATPRQPWPENGDSRRSGRCCACSAANNPRSGANSCGPVSGRRRVERELEGEVRRVNHHVTEPITNIEQLENLLSEPTRGVVETLGRLDGDLIVLGVAGKMGPTLARMARRASDAAGVRRRIIGVARFTN